jgi:hypothetical protein
MDNSVYYGDFGLMSTGDELVPLNAHHTCKKIERLDFSLREHEGEVKA